MEKNMSLSGIKVRKRKQRAGPKSIDEKYTGSEPQFFGVEFKSDKARKLALTHSLQWYNYHVSNKEKSKYLSAFMKDCGYAKNDISLAISVNAQYIPNAVIALARMMKNGFEATEDERTFVQGSIKSLMERGIADQKPDPIEELKPKFKPNPQKAMKEKVDDLLLGEIEELIDGWNVKFEEYSIIDMINKTDIKPAAYRFVIEYHQKMLDELKSNDEQMVEGYSHLKRRDKSKRIKFLEQTINELETHAASKKAVKSRAPRKKKAVDVTKLVKRVKFMKSDSQYKIQSAAPETIIGASGVILFNTKYRIFTQLMADGPSGLSIKGTTVNGFSDEDSIRKNVRNPQDVIKDMLKKTPKVCYNTIDKLKTKPQDLNGRINEHTIILRVFK